jgi:hypothetical protein
LSPSGQHKNIPAPDDEMHIAGFCSKGMLKNGLDPAFGQDLACRDAKSDLPDCA